MRIMRNSMTRTFACHLDIFGVSIIRQSNILPAQGLVVFSLFSSTDVIVKKNTLQSLYNGALQQKQCGIAAAVTTDEKGIINYPYLHAKGHENQVYPEKKALQLLLFTTHPRTAESI